ncbi:MAG: class I SAM-dependent methyltransferase [Candidatus Baltobacteraceae bacterium]
MSSSFRRSGKRRGQRFDADNNVVTESLIFLGELDPEQIGEALEDATHYEPTPLADFDALLQAAHVEPAQHTFLDVGSGMGRVLMLASLRPFKQTVGIEISSALCEVSRDNLMRWRRTHPQLACNDVRVKQGDAASARLPAGDLVVYLFNPFGERTLRLFAARLAAHDGAVVVLYHTPVHRAVFDEHPAFQRGGEVQAGALYRRR